MKKQAHLLRLLLFSLHAPSAASFLAPVGTIVAQDLHTVATAANPGRSRRLRQTSADEGESENGLECEKSDDSKCDLAKVLERDLKEGQERRNGQVEEESEEPNQLNDAIDTILETSFVRRQDGQGMRSMFFGKRYYARNGPFEKQNIAKAPQIEDLFPNPTPIRDSFYLSLPAALGTFLGSAAVFPYISNFLVAS